MKTKALSHRQSQMLAFIRHFLEIKGYPPTIREILKACDISSTSVVDYNLAILVREGYIRRDSEVSRGIELLDSPRRLVRVPIIGQIAAGEPIPVPDSDTWNTASSETIELPLSLTQGRDKIFALKVKGTSMVDALINDGDIVLMQQESTANNGEMVAVWLKNESEVTLKRFYLEPGRIRLQPANSQMHPIYVDPNNVDVQGKVIAVIRQIK